MCSIIYCCLYILVCISIASDCMYSYLNVFISYPELGSIEEINQSINQSIKVLRIIHNASWYTPIDNLGEAAGFSKYILTRILVTATQATLFPRNRRSPAILHPPAHDLWLLKRRMKPRQFIFLKRVTAAICKTMRYDALHRTKLDLTKCKLML